MKRKCQIRKVGNLPHSVLILNKKYDIKLWLILRQDSLPKLAGWDSPDDRTRNIGGFKFKSFEEFETTNFFLKEVVMDLIPCMDHERMGTDTYYPPIGKGACFR